MGREEEINKLTVANLKLLTGNNPLFQSLYRGLLVDSYDTFVEHVEDELASCIQQLEENPEHHHNQSEDQVTIAIRDMLVQKGIDAAHDVQHGGHVDLFIKKDTWKYLVEAKIYSGNAYNYEGWLQLTTRYASGNLCNKGMLLIYLQSHSNTLKIMQDWKTHLEGKVDNINVNFCNKNPLALVSTHDLIRTGSPYHVRHLSVSLYFKPLDKSGRNSKKHS